MKLVSLDSVIELLVELGDLKGTEPLAHAKPGHGPCCTCQTCGFCYDDCVCSHNELLAALHDLPEPEFREVTFEEIAQAHSSGVISTQ